MGGSASAASTYVLETLRRSGRCGVTPFCRRAAVTDGSQLHVRTSIGLGHHPAGPNTDRIRSLLAVLLVEPLWVIDFRVRVRPRARD